MRNKLLLARVIAAVFIASGATCSALAADDPLLGVWNATSMIANGSAAPDEAVKLMRFTIERDRLLMRGNRGSEEDTCTYKIDTSKSPSQLDFTPAKEPKPILAIYELKGDELKLCIRHAASDQGRPTEFVSTPGSKLVLITLKRQAKQE